MTQKYQPLYLKYRPQSLSDLIGQHAVVQTLTNALEHDRICHAYLFTGPRGTGKTSSARILAKSLNCEKGPTAKPCQICTACLEIRDGISPAVFELDAASNNSVDDARTIIERAPLVAQGGRFKLYIIDECHMLTKEAFNALLKTIEEPPEKVIFILATTEEFKVPPTIVSRCQRLMFRLVNQEELIEHLRYIASKEEINIQPDALELIARRAAGGLRDALGLLDQASLLSSKAEAVDLTALLNLLGAVHEDVLLQISKGVQDKDGGVVISAVNSLLSEGREPAVLIQELAKHFLNLAKACYQNRNQSKAISELAVLGSPRYLVSLKIQAQNYDPTDIAQIVELLDKLEQTCRRSSQPALNLEIGLLSICHRHDFASGKEMEQRIANIEKALADNDLPFSAPINKTQGNQEKPNKAPSPMGETNERPGSLFAEDLEHAPASSGPETYRQSKTKLIDESGSDTADDTTPAANLDLLTVAQSLPASPLLESSPEIGEALNSESEPDVSLEVLWSDLLDELQRRHLPTYSLVQAHAFALNFTNNELTIGVRRENFQKILENKADHIKAAFAALTGKSITVRIKVVSEANFLPPTRTKAAPTFEQESQSAESLGEPERVLRTNITSGKSADADSEDGENAFGELSSSPLNRAGAGSATATLARQTKEMVVSTAPSKLSSQSPLEREDTSRPVDANLVHEAYKLFEGPGSRLIG